MYHPRLKGKYYDMGFKYGDLLYKNNFILPEIEERKLEFGFESYKELKHFFPEVTEEIRGFADGVKSTEEKVAAFILSIGAFEHEAQCSIFAFSGDSNVIFGRNFDFLFKFQKFTESSLICPEGKYAYISQSDVFIGREDGINEKGLAIAMTYVNGLQTKPGVNYYFIVRYVLEHCATTDEAVNIIQKSPISTNNNFLIADAAGSLAVIEATPFKTVVRKPESHSYILCTNQFQTDEMKVYEKAGVEWSKSGERRDGIDSFLKGKKDLSIEEAKQILSDKKSCVCLNIPDAGFGTLWSVVANLKTLEIHRAEGLPKFNNYKQETRLSWWLNKKKK